MAIRTLAVAGWLCAIVSCSPAATARDWETMTAEEVYAQRWTREDVERTLAESREWLNNDIGKGQYAPPPWTPMQVDGQRVECWGRTYTYADSLLPVQILSLGQELLAAPAVCVLEAGGKTYEFRQAAVGIEKKHDGLVVVTAVSRLGPYTLKTTAAYEFDGMGRIELELAGHAPAPEIESFRLDIPVRTEKAVLFHFTGARRLVGKQPDLQDVGLGDTHPNVSETVLLQPDGIALNRFREILWLGDRETGLIWFAESMRGWAVKDESGIQTIRPAGKDIMVLRLKLADQAVAVDGTPLAIVFGLQATPMRPRPADFRSLPNTREGWGKNRLHFQWYSWNEGHYYLAQTSHPDKARDFVAGKRAQGLECMPVSSLQYHGMYRYYKGPFGVMHHPGMKHLPLIVWHATWGDICPCTQPGPQKKYAWPPQEAQRLKETALHDRAAGKAGGLSVDEALQAEHVAETDGHGGGKDWYGKEHRPAGANFYIFCPASSYQDWYIWTLDRFIATTGLGALYLDQQMRACPDAAHGCGYIDHRGEWAGEAPIFAWREMAKRIYFTFLERNGTPPIIKWHQSYQTTLPALSFADILWDGEAYRGAGRPRSITENHFYSAIMDEAIMQVPHMGRQFGFAPSLLPQMTHSRLQRTPAAVRDMIGLFMVHDSFVDRSYVPYPKLLDYIQSRKFAYPLDTMKVAYYWEENSGVRVAPGHVKSILHYDATRALLILFNWSGACARARVELDLNQLGIAAEDAGITDVLAGFRLDGRPAGFDVDILPRDLRMLEIGAPLPERERGN